MSGLQIPQIDMCCNHDKAYTVTYSEDSKYVTTQKACNTCFNLELKSKNYPDRPIKPFQRNIVKIICDSCSTDVTESMGCNPKETIPS